LRGGGLVDAAVGRVGAVADRAYKRRASILWTRPSAVEAPTQAPRLRRAIRARKRTFTSRRAQSRFTPPIEDSAPMRAEAEQLVETIKQSLGLLRRHL